MPCQILPAFPPGTARGNTCYSCGAAPRTVGVDQVERVVDFMQTIEGEGFLMLCESCVVEAAQGLGMCTADDLDAHLANVDELREEVAVAVARAEAAEELAAALRRFDGQPAFTVRVGAETSLSGRQAPGVLVDGDGEVVATNTFTAADGTEYENGQPVEPAPQPDPETPAKKAAAKKQTPKK